MLRVALFSFGLLLTAAVQADGDHKHEFAADIKVFHDVLAPLWHAPAGPERIKGICNAVSDLETKATAIVSSNSESLRKSVVGLKHACASADADRIAGQFSAVHDEFHRLID